MIAWGMEERSGRFIPTNQRSWGAGSTARWRTCREALMRPTWGSTVISPSTSSRISLPGVRAGRSAMPPALSRRARRDPNSKIDFCRPRVTCPWWDRIAMEFSTISTGPCSGPTSRVADGLTRAWLSSPCRPMWVSTSPCSGAVFPLLT